MSDDTPKGPENGTENGREPEVVYTTADDAAPKPTDQLAKAREAKAQKAAKKGDEPEMVATRRVETRTETYMTPKGRDVTRTVETTFESKPKQTRRKVIYSDADLRAMDEANRRKNADLFGRITKLALLIAALVLVVGLALTFAGKIGNSSDATPNTGNVTEAPAQVEVPPPPVAEATPNVPEVAPTPVPRATPAPAPRATPAPAPEPRAAPAPVPSPQPTAPVQQAANTALNYVVHPFADRRDDFVNYDFDRRRVCWANSSGRANFHATECVRYEGLDTETKAAYDRLCRVHYAFPEVCPADVTMEVVLREIEYHYPDS